MQRGKSAPTGARGARALPKLERILSGIAKDRDDQSYSRQLLARVRRRTDALGSLGREAPRGEYVELVPL